MEELQSFFAQFVFGFLESDSIGITAQKHANEQ